MLKRVADIASHAIRQTDLAARYGGDEFADRAARHAAATCAIEVAERLRTTIAAARLRPDGQALTVSVGVAVLGDGASSKDDLLQQADDALAAAKLSGRSRFMCAPATAAAVATAGR